MNGLLGTEVGGFDVSAVERQQDRVAVVEQMKSEADALVVEIGIVEQPVELRLDPATAGAESVIGDSVVIATISQGESLLKYRLISVTYAAHPSEGGTSSNSRQRRSKWARPVWRWALVKPRYSAQPSDPMTPEYALPRILAASGNPRPRSIR